MGAVYEAAHLRLGKRVAVKLMAPEIADDDQALARFRREAEVTSQLGHPHIVNVFDFGALPTGEPFLVMEYLEGEDLCSRIERCGRLSVRASLRIARQVASALSATHERGIVHRDLKPANIFLVRVAGEDAFVKVVDFGVSKVKGAGQKLTQTAALLGTPRYMSPEQAKGLEDVDHRTDQFALGAIVYEMLSGAPAFSGEGVWDVMYKVLNVDPAPIGILPEVEAAVRTAMAKDPAARFPDVLTFAQALEQAAGLTPIEEIATDPAFDPRTLKATAPTLPGKTRQPLPATSTTFRSTTGQLRYSAPVSTGQHRSAHSARTRWIFGAVGAGLVATLVAGVFLGRSPSGTEPVRAHPSVLVATQQRPPATPPMTPPASKEANQAKREADHVRIEVVDAPPGVRLKVDGVD
jgi:serine/threonine-protein kinase